MCKKDLFHDTFGRKYSPKGCAYTYAYNIYIYRERERERDFRALVFIFYSLLIYATKRSTICFWHSLGTLRGVRPVGKGVRAGHVASTQQSRNSTASMLLATAPETKTMITLTSCQLLASQHTYICEAV